ncbi:hypothetical protein Tco_0898318 [Tanacetum coccineum]
MASSSAIKASMRAWNRWSQEHSLWFRVIIAMFGDRGGFIDKPGINLFSHMKKKVGNGVHTLFWEYNWLTDSPLMQIYPRLFALECNKHAIVVEKLSDISLIFSFRRTPRGGAEEEKLVILLDNIYSVGESCSHLFFSCNMARLLLSKVARWWELDIPDFFILRRLARLVYLSSSSQRF